MKRVLLILSFCAAAFAQTHIADTLHTGAGATVNGSITITPSTSFAVVGVGVVPAESVVVISNGVLSTSLYANPVGTSYRVSYNLRGVAGFVETWVVPDTTNTLAVADVRQDAISYTLSLSNITGGAANNGDCPVFNSTTGHWEPGPCGSAGGGSVNLTGSNGITVSPNPITGSGNISGIAAAADGTTVGVATFAPNDFNSSAGLISLDYTNGQKATDSLPGFISAADHAAFNGKQPAGSYATLNNTNMFTGRQDATGSASTAPTKTGTVLPATCVVGDLFFKSDATAGQNLYECQSLNSWTQQLNSGSGGASAALDNLSAVNINTSLLAQSSVNLGSASKPFGDLYLVGSGVFGANYFRFTGPPTAARTVTIPDASGTLLFNSRTISTTGPITGGGDLSADRTFACPTCGVTGSPLSQFAATTSAQLAAILSDESGTGNVCFTVSCVMTTPNLGVPSAMTATNVTGLPLSTGVTGLLGLSHGGANADLSATGGASQVLKQTTSGGNISVGRLACADLSDSQPSCATDATNASNIASGTLGASRLPNPSATTLGGTESLAAASHKWINTISTSGVPSATQPICADLSDSSGGCAMSTTAGGDLSGTLPNPSVAKVNGIAYSATAGAHSVEVVTTANTTATPKVVPDCTDTAGNHLNYTQSSDAFSCGTSSSGGGGAGFFASATAVNSTFSATPTFSLADVSSKSPTRFEPGAMTANVTSVTFSNKVAGAKFSLVWLQDGTGGRSVSYGASATGACAPDVTANATTVQFFEVASDGSTVYGVGCHFNNAILSAAEVAAPGTPTSSNWNAWGDSTNHVFSFKANGSSTVSNTAVPNAGGTNLFLTAFGANGAFSSAQPAFNNLSGQATTAQLPSVINFTGKTETAPMMTGSTAGKPSTCTVGDLYFANDATAGQNIYECASTNTWTQQLNSGGGGGGSGTVTSVTCGTGLTGGTFSTSGTCAVQSTLITAAFHNFALGGATLTDDSTNNTTAFLQRVVSTATPDSTHPNAFWTEGLFTTLQYLLFNWQVEANYSTAPVAKVVYYTTSATTNNVAFSVGLACTASGGSSVKSHAFATANTSSDDTVPGTSGIEHIVSFSLTNVDSIAALSNCDVYLRRATPSGTDASGTISVKGFGVAYTALF